jgi:hypothetical protein
LRALQDDAVFGLRTRDRERPFEQRLIRDHAIRFDPARGRENQLRLRVVDPRRELLRREPPEHDRVNRPDPRAGEHRHDRLGDHRHVDHHAVTALDAQPHQQTGELRHRVAQLAEAEHALRLRDGAVVYERRLVAAAALGVSIERVVTGVGAATDEPARGRLARRVEHPVEASEPVHRFRRAGPEALGIVQGLPIQLVESLGHHSAPRPHPLSGSRARGTVERRSPRVDALGAELTTRLARRRA